MSLPAEKLWWFVRLLAMLGLLGAASGCGSRDQLMPGGTTSGSGGAAGTGGGHAGTGGTGGSGASIPDGGVATYGVVELFHEIVRDGYEWEQLTLHGAFYGEPYDPETDRPDHVETRQTPDGVSCGIYYQSGMIEDPPPPPPAQVDGGRITVWAGGDPTDALEISFQGDQYDVDSRENSTQGMPLWLTEEAIEVTFEGHGSSSAGTFTEPVTLAATPTIVAPQPGQQPIPPGPDGNFLIAWEPVGAERIIVTLAFNLDWDNSAFICHPAAGTTQLLLPSDWINEWTWGTGELFIVSRHEVAVLAEPAAVTIRTSRYPRRSVSFEIEW